MSFSRENVIWQSADGTWSRGFFETIEVGDPFDDDWDPEFDVEYNFDTFEWVSTGHPTEEAAARSWTGANPGGHGLLSYPADDEEWQRQVDQYDDMAARMWEGEAPEWRRSGVRKRRVPWLIAQDIVTALTNTAHYKLGGYANICADTSPLQAQLDARRAELTVGERQRVLDVLNEGVTRIQSMLDASPSWSTGRSEAREALHQLEKQVEPLTGRTPARRPSSSSTTETRRKTSAASTAGSFAPRINSAPSGALRPE